MRQTINRYLTAPFFAGLALFSGNCTGTCGTCSGSCLGSIALFSGICGTYLFNRSCKSQSCREQKNEP